MLSASSAANSPPNSAGRDKELSKGGPMTQYPSVELDERLEELTITVEETVEELEERVAPRLAANHNETLVIDSED
jgi:hypothetical protein